MVRDLKDVLRALHEPYRKFLECVEFYPEKIDYYIDMFKNLEKIRDNINNVIPEDSEVSDEGEEEEDDDEPDEEKILKPHDPRKLDDPE
jgi:hypothetical protein